MYKNPQYINGPSTDVPSCIRVEINGATLFVPLDPANTDYQLVMKLVEDGELIIAEPENTE
jgi:hypothetical protein